MPSFAASSLMDWVSAMRNGLASFSDWANPIGGRLQVELRDATPVVALRGAAGGAGGRLDLLGGGAGGGGGGGLAGGLGAGGACRGDQRQDGPDGGAAGEIWRTATSGFPFTRAWRISTRRERPWTGGSAAQA